MSHAQYEETASQYRAMVFGGPERMTEARVSVTAAMDATFGVRLYTTTEGWLLGGAEGNGTVNAKCVSESPVWIERVAKARRDIGVISRESRVRLMADRIGLSEIENDIEEIRQWAQLLKRT